MNRQQRRASEAQGKRFVAKCLMCTADTCHVHVTIRFGERDLGICKGCPCAAERCAFCHRIGEHWLGCPAVGIPSENRDRVLQ